MTPSDNIPARADPPGRQLLLATAHPLRLALANEVHSRPSAAWATPSRATFVALLVAPAERALELQHLRALCSHFDAAPPEPGASHFAAAFGELQFKWERHGEFSDITCIAPGASGVLFDDAPALLLPSGWLAALPGSTLVAAHARLIAAQPGAAVAADAALLSAHFGGQLVAGGSVGAGAGAVFSDFRVHADGLSRFLLIDAGFTSRQAGRMLQRLLEIETYRMMALLALPVAHALAPRLAEIEAALGAVTASIAAERAPGDADDEDLLHVVTRLAAQVESELAASQFRFSACRAYGALVDTRIAELREQRLAGVQPIGEFMARRFTPAVATCATVEQRLRELSERVARASALLSTRVDIARERQNQALLASMDRRARLQLRLQQTVEGLSVAAIVYYAAGLVGALAKALQGAGLRIAPDLVVGISIPLLALAVLLATRRARRHALEGDAVAVDRSGEHVLR